MRLSILILSALVVLASAGPVAVGRPKLDGRIIGGSDADIADYPYQVSLVWWTFHICGGSIISSRYVVTAAHCTDGDDAADLQIRAGTSFFTGGVLVQVEAIHQNPQYDSFTIDFDISVLHLARDLDLTAPGIAAIALPELNQPIIPGSDAVCTGWGVTTEGGNEPDQLQVVTVQMVSNAKCNEAYTGDITDRMNCAGIEDIGGKDACQGDSGGPLVVDGKLTGVVSWGYGCARPQYPGVYSSVPNMRDFVAEVSGV